MARVWRYGGRRPRVSAAIRACGARRGGRRGGRTRTGRVRAPWPGTSRRRRCGRARRGRRRARRGGDPDARADVDRLAADLDRRRDRVEDALGDVVQLATVGDVLQQHHELVAAEARHHVVGPHRVAQPRGGRESSASPASWPSTSFTSLNRSRSTNSSADRAGAVAAAEAPGSRALEEQRAGSGRPVSGSWVAWRASAAWARLRSVMSSVDANAIGQRGPGVAPGTPCHATQRSSRARPAGARSMRVHRLRPRRARRGTTRGWLGRPCRASRRPSRRSRVRPSRRRPSAFA